MLATRMKQAAAGGAYLLHDTFLTDRAAGAVNGTTAEPGPGLRETVENDGSISISSGILNFSGQTTVTYGDLVMYYSIPFSRAVGRTVEFRVRRNSGGVCAGIGLFNDPALALANRIHCFQLNGAGVDLRGDPATNGVANLTISTWVRLKIVVAATGCQYFVNDVSVGSGTSFTQTPLYVGITDGDMNLDVDYIKVWGGPGLGALMLSFDDAFANIYGGFEYASAAGLKATLYVITDKTDVDPLYLTSAQLQAMGAAGWAIANHTNGLAELTTLTEAQQVTALTSARDALNGWGLTSASRHVAYPNGSYDATTLSAMATAGMLTGRKTGSTSANPGVDPIYEIPTRIQAVITSTTLATIKTAIRGGVADGKWPIINFHELSDSPTGAEWSNANFVALVDWVVGCGIEVKTIVDLYNAS